MKKGVQVLPPTDDESLSVTTRSPFHWLRQTDVVVVDLTGDVGWVLYEAGAAQALGKHTIPIEQAVDNLDAVPSAVRWQLPRVVEYKENNVGNLAEYIIESLERSAPGSDEY